jgi:asparagine synthase (glutamine-hydrolysing)
LDIDLDLTRFGMPLAPRSPPVPVEPNSVPPVAALQRAIARELSDGSPCYVAFSGGCDSSLVLSAATVACRAMGVADPVPVTYRYADEQSDERDFQELVVRRLGLQEWVKFDFGIEADFLSPDTCAELTTMGPLWPPAPLTRARALRTLDSGVWLTGEGGDAVLGPRRLSHLDVAIGMWSRRPAHPPVRRLRRGLLELAPRPLRGRSATAACVRSYGAEWLHPDLRQDYLRRVGELDASEPLRPSLWFGHYLARPHVTIGHASLQAFKARFGLRWVAPLVDQEFLGSLRGGLGWRDYRGRRHLLRSFFSELLPDEIIERRSKATFNTALFGPYTRAFAARWEGTGAPAGVDAEWLKQHWVSDAVSAGTAPLLHHVWLASEGGRAPDLGEPCR